MLEAAHRIAAADEPVDPAGQVRHDPAAVGEDHLHVGIAHEGAVLDHAQDGSGRVHRPFYP